MAAGEEYGIAAVRPRRPRHAAHRDGLPAARPGHHASTSPPSRPGSAWAVGWKKHAFWGRDALLAEKEDGPKRRLRGLVAIGRGIPRPGMGVTLTPDVPLADITSGTFSPTLKKGIGLALIPTMVAEDAQVGVDIRGRREIFQLDQAAVRRPVGARSPDVNLPEPAADVPPAHRRRAAVVVAPRGRVRRGGRGRRPLADQRFANQADAESWVGEIWADLAEHGVDAVTLFEHDRRSTDRCR